MRTRGPLPHRSVLDAMGVLREAVSLELVGELEDRIWSGDPPDRQRVERLLVYVDAAAKG
jgi:hypothetical protein